MWPLFLGIHLVGLSGYNLLLRRSDMHKIDRWTLATILQTGIVLPLLFVLPFASPDPRIYHPQRIALVCLVIALTIALQFTNVKALQYLEASVYSVLYNLRILFTSILGIVFFHDTMLPLQIIGAALIFLAVVTVRQKGKQAVTRRGIEWGIAAGVVISLLNTSEKELINQVGFLGDVVPAMIGATIIMWGVLLARKQTIPLSTFRQPQIIWLMILRACSAYGFILTFYYGGKLAVSSYISSLSVIIIVVLGIVLLGEKDYLKQKLIATAMAALGLTCILLANLHL